MTDFAEMRKGLPEGAWTLNREELRGGSYWTIRVPGLDEELDFWIGNPHSEAVARAIAAIPDMLAEIERLRAELAIWNQPGAMVRKVRGLQSDLIEHRAENDRLRALNAEMRNMLQLILLLYEDNNPLKPLPEGLIRVDPPWVDDTRAILAKTEEPQA